MPFDTLPFEILQCASANTAKQILFSAGYGETEWPRLASIETFRLCGLGEIRRRLFEPDLLESFSF